MKNFLVAAIIGIAFTPLLANAEMEGEEKSKCSKCVLDGSKACNDKISHTSCLKIVQEICIQLHECPAHVVPPASEK